MTQVILDISRLISRVRYSTPSGVDRVEMAYARGLLGLYGEDLAFAAVHPTGIYGRLRRLAALAYLDELEQRWSHQDDNPRQRSLPSVLPWLARLLPTGKGVGSAPGAVYLQVSPHHLINTGKVHAILRREQARFMVMVHDLIPIEFPEYARPAGAEQHRRRMRTVAELADAVIVNSAATGASLTRWIEAEGNGMAPPPVHVALLGTERLAPAAPASFPDGRPYFLCLGTIEPRKNHLLLLHLWRHLAETLPVAQVPRLVIVGRRGWENEQVVDLLERCPALKGHVEEINNCPDTRLSALLRGARALVMPSFAEGYGMPVAEALSVGTPAICSDLAALREVGGEIPEFLDPLDGPGWGAAIMDYAKEGPRYGAQMVRLQHWHNPSWDAHMAIVAGAVGDLRNSPRA